MVRLLAAGGDGGDGGGVVMLSHAVTSQVSVNANAVQVSCRR